MYHLSSLLGISLFYSCWSFLLEIKITLYTFLIVTGKIVTRSQFFQDEIRSSLSDTVYQREKLHCCCIKERQTNKLLKLKPIDF